MNQKTTYSRFKSNALVLFVAAYLLFQALSVSAAETGQGRSLASGDDPTPPASVVKLIFIHHSTGQNWLDDSNGGLGLALSQNNYFVSDTNYGWGPNSIGDSTDIPNWLEWFRSTDTPTYLAALYVESGILSPYTRTLADPGGENEIIMFKSCFPNSALEGNPDDPPSSDGWLTVGHAKYVYNQLLIYFLAHPDKLFVVITAPPLIDGTYAANARAFNQWLIYNWLSENNYILQNVAVFDFYNVLTGPDNHHRYYNNGIQHIFTPGMNTEYYPSSDDHPSQTGNLKATSEFLPLLNIFYHRWANNLNPPSVTTGSATNVTSNSATLNGTVNANNSSTTVTFQYGLTTAYGTTVDADQSPVTGNSDTTVSKAITGLTANTTYHYRVVGVNSAGTSYGSDLTFTTPAAPTVTTNAASGVTTSGAILNGTANANNSSTTVTFKYGLSNEYENTVTADQSPVTGNSDTAVSKAITGLNANTTYHYQVKGENSVGTTYGEDKTFYTSGYPDFNITNITLSPGSIAANSTFSANITVKNQGTVSGDGGYLDAWANQSSSQSCGATGDKRASVGTLAVGYSQTFTLSGFSAGSAGSKTFRAFVDSQCQTTETDDTNNQYTKSWGDQTSTVKIGVFRNGAWYLDNNDNMQWDNCTTDRCLSFGLTNDTPVVGDWDGSGTAKIGIFRNGIWVVDNNGNGEFDNCTTDPCNGFGMPGDTPVVGDWDGSSRAKIGIFRNGVWVLDYNGNMQFDDCITDSCNGFGMTGDTPVVGDWDGSGRAKIGIFRNGIWVLDYNGNEQFDDCTTDHCLGFGMTGDTPVVGDWDGSGTAKIGIFRDGLWVLDYNGNGQFDDCITDICIGFGMTGDTPVTGAW